MTLLPKGNKQPGDPPSYCPICLLDTMGKILEGIIASRLRETAEYGRALSDMLFGFRKHRSIVDIIKAVVDTAATAIKGEIW